MIFLSNRMIYILWKISVNFSENSEKAYTTGRNKLIPLEHSKKPHYRYQLPEAINETHRPRCSMPARHVWILQCQCVLQNHQKSRRNKPSRSHPSLKKSAELQRVRQETPQWQSRRIKTSSKAGHRHSISRRRQRESIYFSYNQSRRSPW